MVVTSVVKGDLSIRSAINSALHGLGKVFVNSDVELNNATTNQVLKTTTQSLTVQSAKANTVTALAGDLTLSAVNAGAGKVIVTASDAASGGLQETLGGFGRSTTATGPVVVSSTANKIDLTAAAASTWKTTSGDLTVESTGGKLVAKGSGGTDVGDLLDTTVKSGTANSLTLQGGTGAGGKVVMDAVTLDIGKTNATAINVGKAGIDVNIAGNLIVAGATTTVDTQNLLVKDNLIVVNEAPPAAGRDAGVLFQRHESNVIETQSGSTTNVSVWTNTTTFDVAAIQTAAIGYYVQLEEGANVETRKITNVAGSTITVDPAFANAYTVAATAKFYANSSGVMYLDESEDRMIFAYTHTPSVGSALVTPTTFMPIKAQSLELVEGIAMAGFATVQVSIAQNAVGSANAVQIPFAKTRGSFEIIVESVLADGAAATWRISKGEAASDSFVSMGVSSPAKTGFDEQLEIQWKNGENVSLYHVTGRTGGDATLLVYKVKYLTI